MPTSIHWFVPDRVVYVGSNGVVTLEEMTHAQQFNTSLLDATTHELGVHIIFDTRATTKTPTNISEVRKLNQSLVSHPKLGWVIVLEGNTVLRFISSMMAQLSHIHMKPVATWEDALVFLDYIDSTMSPLPSEPPTGEPLARFG